MNQLQFHPLTPDRWIDFEGLFGTRGACGGCWCMYWRLTSAEFNAAKGEGARKLMKELVDTGEIPGLLAYQNEEPIAWCSIAPREHFGRLARSRILKPIDDLPVWSIVCFFVKRSVRRLGVSEQLLRAAAEDVASRGGKILEGYPVEPKKEEMPDVFAYTGLSSAFLKAGFTEVARRSETRPIMRLNLGESTNTER